MPAVVVDLDAHEKAYQTLRARLALSGYTLSRSDRADGPTVFFVSRWGMVRELASIDAADDFARQVGAAG